MPPSPVLTANDCLRESLRVFEFLGFAEFACLDERFDLLLVSLAYGNRDFLRIEEIARITRLNRNLFAFAAEIFNGLDQ